LFVEDMLHDLPRPPRLISSSHNRVTSVTVSKLKAEIIARVATPKVAVTIKEVTLVVV
jgi:hypothetical protein